MQHQVLNHAYTKKDNIQFRHGTNQPISLNIQIWKLVA